MTSEAWHSPNCQNPPYLNGPQNKPGVYEIHLTREWFRKAAPVLKVITTTASLIIPTASAAVKPALDDAF